MVARKLANAISAELVRSHGQNNGGIIVLRDRPQNRNLIRPAKGTRLPGAGRKKGTPNKFTRDLKEAIIQAANKAGGKEGLIGFLTKQAEDNPRQFLTLLGRVLPLTIEGNVGVTLEALVLDAARRREERDAKLVQRLGPQ